MEPRYRIINTANELTDPEAQLLETMLSCNGTPMGTAIRSILERDNGEDGQTTRGGCIIASAEQFRNDLKARCRQLLSARLKAIHKKLLQPAD